MEIGQFWGDRQTNTLFDSGVGHGDMRVKDVVGHFGVSQGSVSQRSGPLLGAIGVIPNQYGAMNPGSPVYLTSARRNQIIASADRYRATAG